ncbi:hypothetical protein H257_08626 [Aphanomyces astaci]|uniref:Uncharacterized protein n=1 Tax=Aphanomyces astaci TaxID=112090 RepID=W4GDL3_APHAT|nr:hypothetical protein H257_08626 [Aphanomyces astaci]ETV77782.1 hypothetical protein H257_08626 [Aphanomyces astaci]|eukprot:XP_009832892.1 hypothetical protein H257_08626 [Aphanomyces astaci]
MVRKGVATTTPASPNVTYTISSLHSSKNSSSRRPSSEHKRQNPPPNESLATKAINTHRPIQVARKNDLTSGMDEVALAKTTSSQDIPLATTYVGGKLEKHGSLRDVQNTVDRSSQPQMSNAWVLEKQNITKPQVRADPKPRLGLSNSPPKARLPDESSSPSKATPWWSNSNSQSTQQPHVPKSTGHTRSLIVHSDNTVEDIERWSGAKWDKDKGFVKMTQHHPLPRSTSSTRGPEMVSHELASATIGKAKRHDSHGRQLAHVGLRRSAMSLPQLPFEKPSSMAVEELGPGTTVSPAAELQRHIRSRIHRGYNDQ